ncbi:MAG: type IV pilus biogenesis/stability protein PilW [Zoogloeaceae bacterium]|jgi:type IV pilus assembly protein PilF|nr:type IV pilus biogenesis/stability protein PilW [Zoogloeaceae bacterium]
MKRFFPEFAIAFFVFSALFPAAIAQIAVPESGRAAEGNQARTRSQIHTELSTAYFQDGIYTAALEEANIAIAADSSFASAYGLRGLIYAALGDRGAADSDFRRALSIEASDPNINNNYGWFLCQQNNPAAQKAALPHFLKAIQNPLYATPEIAYINAGACTLKQGDKETARDFLLRAVRFSRDGSPQAQVYLAQIAYLEGSLVEARNRLLDIFQNNWVPSPEALWLAIRVEHRLNNSGEKESLIAQLRRLYPASPEYQAYLKGTYE